MLQKCYRNLIPLSSDEFNPIAGCLMRQALIVGMKALKTDRAIPESCLKDLQTSYQECNQVYKQYNDFQRSYQNYSKEAVQTISDTLINYQKNLLRIVKNQLEIEEGEIKLYEPPKELIQFQSQLQKAAFFEKQKDEDDRWIKGEINQQEFKRSQQYLQRHQMGEVVISPQDLASKLETLGREARIVYEQAYYKFKDDSIAPHLMRTCEELKKACDDDLKILSGDDNSSGKQVTHEQAIEKFFRYQRAVFSRAELAIMDGDQSIAGPRSPLSLFVERLRDPGICNLEQWDQKRLKDYQDWIQEYQQCCQIAREKYDELLQRKIEQYEEDEENIEKNTQQLVKELYTIKKGLVSISSLLQKNDIQPDSPDLKMSQQHREAYDHAMQRYNQQKKLNDLLEPITLLEKLCGSSLQLTELAIEAKSYNDPMEIDNNTNILNYELTTYEEKMSNNTNYSPYEVKLKSSDDMVGDMMEGIEIYENNTIEYIKEFQQKSRKTLKILEKVCQSAWQYLKQADINFDQSGTSPVLYTNDITKDLNERINWLSSGEPTSEIVNALKDYYRQIAVLVELAIVHRPKMDTNQRPPQELSRFWERIERERKQPGQWNADADDAYRKLMEILASMRKEDEKKFFWFHINCTLAVAVLKNCKTDEKKTYLSINEGGLSNKKQVGPLPKGMEWVPTLSTDRKRHAEIVLLEEVRNDEAQNYDWEMVGLTVSRKMCLSCSDRYKKVVEIGAIAKDAIAAEISVGSLNNNSLQKQSSTDLRSIKEEQNIEIPDDIQNIEDLIKDVEQLGKRLKSGKGRVTSALEIKNDSDVDMLDANDVSSGETSSSSQNEGSSSSEEEAKEKYSDRENDMDVDVETVDNEGKRKDFQKGRSKERLQYTTLQGDRIDMRKLPDWISSAGNEDQYIQSVFTCIRQWLDFRGKDEWGKNIEIDLRISTNLPMFQDTQSEAFYVTNRLSELANKKEELGLSIFADLNETTVKSELRRIWGIGRETIY